MFDLINYLTFAVSSTAFFISFTAFAWSLYDDLNHKNKREKHEKI